MRIRNSILVVALILFIAGFLYYPKWKKGGSEATLSWDVSGYYLYLPATFIYNDLKKLSFYDEVLKTYRPTPDFQQAYDIENGNKVLKYSMGLGIQFLPGFLVSHIYAKSSSTYKADGYSRPYQLGIAIWSYCIAIIGLFYLSRILLLYYNKQVVSLCLISYVIATNYLEYTGITNSMAHNYLFTLYAILIWQTIQFYKYQKWKNALAIGFICGLMALTRPTELIAIAIPIFWGFQPRYFKKQIDFWLNNYKKIITAAILCGAIGSFQLFYWKYVSGHWIQYSYQDQGFSWLRPHLYDGLFHFRAGWLIYSPIMIFSLIGFYFLYQQKRKLFWIITGFSLLFIYISFAWDIWWYGGSLGQRTMVQVMPVLAFSFSAFLQYVIESKNRTIVYLVILAVCGFLNFWITHHAHLGKFFYPEQMTQNFYLEVLGKNKTSQHSYKLLDTKHLFSGFRTNVKSIYSNSFEGDNTIFECNEHTLKGNRSLCLNKDHQFSKKFICASPEHDYDWIRVSVFAKSIEKEWSIWRNAQMIVELNLGEEVTDREMIRLQRLLPDNNSRDLYIDIPSSKPHDKITVYFWNAESDKRIVLDDLRIETFDE